jgi:hypothetical protein
MNAAASYMVCDLIRIFLDVSGLQRKIQHMHDILLLQDDPSNAAQTYKVSAAKNISFGIQEELWFHEWHEFSCRARKACKR